MGFNRNTNAALFLFALFKILKTIKSIRGAQKLRQGLKGGITFLQWLCFVTTEPRNIRKR